MPQEKKNQQKFPSFGKGGKGVGALGDAVTSK